MQVQVPVPVKRQEGKENWVGVFCSGSAARWKLEIGNWRLETGNYLFLARACVRYLTE